MSTAAQHISGKVSARSRGWQTIVVGLIAALLFALLTLPFIHAPREQGRAFSDESHFHLPTIERFAADWPRPNFADYESATTPGYHLLLAIAMRAMHLNVAGLHLVNLLLSCGLIATFAISLARRAAPLAGLGLALPLLCSSYTFASGVWLLPDNLAWWSALLILLIALRSRASWNMLGLGAVLLMAAVFIRQSNLWLAALLWLAAWLGNESTNTPSLPRDPGITRTRRVSLMVLATLPAFAVVLYFFHLWHGATPPAFAANHANGTDLAFQHEGVNPATPCLFLVILGLLSIFEGAALWAGLRIAQPAPRPRIPWLGIAGGFLAGGLPHTSFSLVEGRYSGLWALTRMTPLIADRSIAFVILATLGGASAELWWRALKPFRAGRVLCLACVPFLAAQVVNAAAWQRYLEPWLLMSTALAVAEILRRLDQRPADRQLAARVRLVTVLSSTVLAMLLILAALRTLNG